MALSNIAELWKKVVFGNGRLDYAVFEHMLHGLKIVMSYEMNIMKEGRSQKERLLCRNADERFRSYDI